MTFLLGCAGGVGVFFLFTKKLLPSLKKAPFKNNDQNFREFVGKQEAVKIFLKEGLTFFLCGRGVL